jgi:hypothetical protein
VVRTAIVLPSDDAVSLLLLFGKRRAAGSILGRRLCYLVQRQKFASKSVLKCRLARHMAVPEDRRASATTALSLSQIGKNKISIDGNECVSTLSMLDVSERTLSRLLANGKAPPYAKIAGNYYPLDTVREWAAAMGLVLKTPSDND